MTTRLPSFRVSGKLSALGFRPVRTAGVALLALLACAAPARALIYTYDNTTSGTLSNAATPCTNPLVRSFTVTDSFTVSSIAVGFNASHTTRGDIRVILVAPNNTTLTILNNSADNDDNYDILMSTNTEGALDDNDVDPVAAPFFNRLVSVNTLDTFYTGNAQGTWSLRICDNVAATNGTFNRARLILGSAQTTTSSCTGTVSYDWGANGNGNAFTSATVGDLTISLTTSNNYGNAAASQAFTTRTTTQGNHTGYYALAMDAATAAGTIQSEDIGQDVTFSFSEPVRDLSFSLLDVDWTANSWEDQVSVIAVDSSGNRVPYSMTFPGTTQRAGDTGEGDTTAATTVTDGNINYVFQGEVKSLTLYYSQGDEPTSEAVFMIVGISDFTFCGYDYGDAPDTYGTALNGGARHVLGQRNLYLGTNPPDGEADGQPGSAATTDDTTALSSTDDEDGVASFPNYTPGSTTYTVSVQAKNLSSSQTGYLAGYIDWNRDGDFADANERSATVTIPANTTAPSAAFNVTWNSVPVGAGGTTATYARFRISFTQTEVESPTGLATSGEVEDYPISDSTLPVTLSSFSSRQNGGALDLAWTTETETGNVGFALYRSSAKGLVPLVSKLVPSHQTDSLSPQTYRLSFPATTAAAVVLEEMGLGGERKRYGPFAVGASYGHEPQLAAIDWRAIGEEQESQRLLQLARRASGLALENGFPAAELGVERTGLYRLSYEDLLAAGVDLAGAPVARLGLTEARSGGAVPVYVTAGSATPGIFGPGGRIELRGEAVTNSLYTHRRLYRLAVSAGPALQVRSLDSGTGGSAVASYLETTRINRDLQYSFASPNGDPWFEARLLAQGSAVEQSFALPVDHLAGTSGRLKLELWGVTDWPGSTPDHHVVVLLNGSQLADLRFDGLAARTVEVALPAGLLFEGENQLTVRLPGDTGFAFDLVHVDRYEVSYPRRLAAREGALTWNLPAGGRVEVGGLGSAEVVAYVRGGRVRLSSVQVLPQGGGWLARFTVPRTQQGAAGVDVWSASALLRPTIAPARSVPADLLTGPADYLILSHSSFLAGLDDLVAAREAQALTVKVVDVDDLYRRYTGGEVDPQAIRRYVADAARLLGTHYLLLVGGDTFDYFDNLGLGSISFLPTPYAQTDSLIHFTPADPIYGDLDGDGVEDIGVGRLPARTQGELALLIEKILRYPTAPAGALFAADGSETASFTRLSDQLAARVPADWALSRAYIDQLGTAGAHQQLLAGFNQGPALVNYMGHSGPTVWSFQGLFSTGDAEGLSNLATPSLVVQWGCWNTYHVSPQYDTLAHRLLLAGPQGAASVVGSSTLTKTTSDQALGPLLVAQLLTPGKTLGQAMVEAKHSLAAQGGDNRDVLLGWTLLGDPALVANP